jgi:hypothetical protein
LGWFCEGRKKPIRIWNIIGLGKMGLAEVLNGTKKQSEKVEERD